MTQAPPVTDEEREDSAQMLFDALTEVHEAIKRWAKNDGHPNNMANDAMAWRVQRALSSYRKPTPLPTTAEAQELLAVCKDIEYIDWSNARTETLAAVERVARALKAFLERNAVVGEPTERQLSNIARAIADTMRYPNHIMRAKAVWAAATMADEHPWPTANKPPEA